MKQILIICDGILAKHFLERVFKIKNVLHNYVIIAKSDEFVPQKLKDSENFLIHSFDPTSLEKLRQIVIESEFMQCIVVMDDEFDTKITTANLIAQNGCQMKPCSHISSHREWPTLEEPIGNKGEKK